MKSVLQLGRYLLVDKIASGGMADVYRATLLGVAGFEKNVAIKKILPHWSGNREFIDMLIDEARVLLHLNHANIVQVFELNCQDDIYYLVMEYIDGVDLRQFSRRLGQLHRGFPYPLICFIVRQVCSGLSYAHERKDRNSVSMGIVHRDISPQNILISFEGDVKLTDFGIAKVMGKTNETVVGTLKGKFAYMSPEQAVGGKIDARTDIFALGILLYEMATGERCFKGDTDFETLEAVRQARVAIPLHLMNVIPQGMQNIILKALKKNPEERYQTVAELSADLKKLESEMGAEPTLADFQNFLSEVFSEQLVQKEEAEKELTKQTKIFLKSVSKKTILNSRHTRVLVGDTKLLEGVEAIPTLVDVVMEKMEKVVIRKKPLMMASLLVVILIIGLGWFYAGRSELMVHDVPVSPKLAPAMPAPGKPVPVVPVTAMITPSIPEPALPEPSIPEPASPSEKTAVTGMLQVSSRPWAKVFIPGIVNGAETPFSKKTIPAGTYDLKVVCPQLGKTQTTKLFIHENALVTCQAQFGENSRLVCR